MAVMSPTPERDAWPPLPLAEWKPTYRTLHMWTQMAGKVQLALTPRTNHWWNVALHVTARGLATMPIPHGADVFTVTFDFVDQTLRIDLSRGERREIPLAPQPIANFYERFMATLRALGIEARIWPMPVEVPDPVRFDRDSLGDYDGEAARRCWRILFETDAVFKEFRARFIGKCSPVHFFWGAPDLAVTRFSGRRAPEHPGGIPNLPDWVTREAYSHEVSSCGFWPGGGSVPSAAFYSYAYPEPAGFSLSRVRPGAAFYSGELREFVLPYDVVRESDSPDDTLLDFLQTTYEAAADLGKWDRSSLERSRPEMPGW